MFGSRLKSWMETYIGRPRKKDAQKDKGKRNDVGGATVESSESLACSDTGVSFTSQQVLSSSATDNKEGYSTTTMESEKSGMTHCHTAVSLPSPESAYSTGYSTDGASPGETGPPEYYINIRTGKHYFPSPAPTPTSPQPTTTFLHLHPTDHRLSSPFFPNTYLLPSHSTRPPPLQEPLSHLTKPHTLTKLPNGFPPHLDTTQTPTTLSASVPNYYQTKSPSKKSPISQLTPIRLFLKSPRHTKPENKKQVVSGKPKKWFKQPFQKFGQRRTDETRTEPKKELLEKNFRYVFGQETTASPRQRNRIRTNPWLPTEPLSSQNFHSLNFGFSPSLTRNRSCSNTPLQNRKSGQLEIGGRQKELSDHSEEDLTLNEVMGTYNESYVYEKETDILSDSDPTDCEDYGTDSEAENGGDERDSHDDELDFIDNGSIYEEDFPQNTGRCTYHDVHVKRSSFLHKGDRRKLKSECRKNSRKDADAKRRDKRRQMRRSLKEDEDRKRVKECGGGSSLSRVLAERILARNASKSAEGTPVTRRREKVATELRETHIGSEKENTVGRKVILIDFETDHKYNELMKEAENMYESLRNSPVILNRKEILREGEVTRKPVEVRKTPPRGRKEPGTPARKSPKELDLKLSVETPKKNSFKTKTSAHSPLDPLGPSLRNFAVFSPVIRDERKSSSSSEESEPRKKDKWVPPPASPVVPIAFQSVDLGKPLAPYCPQSEPVKRKIYSCSKTYDKLVKRFENKATVFEESINGTGLGTKVPDTCLDGNQGPFPRERRREEKAPRGGILRRPSGRSCILEQPQRHSDIFR